MDPTAMGGFKQTQIAAFDPNAVAGFKSDQVAAFDPNAVAGFKSDQVAAFDPNAVVGLTKWPPLIQMPLLDLSRTSCGSRSERCCWI